MFHAAEGKAAAAIGFDGMSPGRKPSWRLAGGIVQPAGLAEPRLGRLLCRFGGTLILRELDAEIDQDRCSDEGSTNRCR